MRSDLDFRIFVPFVVATALSIIALVVLMVVLAGRIDTVSADRERALVSNGLDQAIRETENQIAAEALASGPPPPQPGPMSHPAFNSGWADLVAEVEGANATAARLAAPRSVRINGRALQASQFAAEGPALYILTATLTPPPAGESAATPPIRLDAHRLDLQAFAGRYLLEDFSVAPRSAFVEGKHARFDIRDDQGAPVAAVQWTPAAPGSQLYVAAILPILLVVSCIAGMAFLTFGRGRRVAMGLIESEARATHMALHDALTGLPNRVLFADRLGQAVEHLRRRGGSVAVLGLDLDRFKEVNDTFGHQFGDELLVEVSRRLTETCRTSDTVARLGGDEFAVVQSDASPAAAAGLARRLNERLAQPFELSVGRVFIGCSIGISLLESADVSPVDAMRQADLALYRAKEGGRGQFAFFRPEMDAAQRIRRAIEADLRQALAEGALEMAYQSQVDAAGEIIAVEALVRWDHPVRGPVAPEFFVPVAEECGLIDQLGIFTLRRAFLDARNWPEEVKVAINVSAAQLRLKGFVATVEELLAETGATASRFELEITEGVFLGDDPAMHDTLTRLRQMGFALALDDFGTGYSSLNYLRRYPVDKIKIDGSFVASLGSDSEADAVVGAIIKLAKALNLSVVAEGVETPEQRRRLTSAGCGDVQGFLFSRPITAEAMDAALSAARQAAQ